VTGPRTAAYAVQTAATAAAGKVVHLGAAVSNLGKAAWGHAAVVPKVSEAEREPASRALVVARWVSLGSASAIGGAGASTMLPAGMAPGATATVDLSLVAPAAAGEYLVVIDVIDPVVGSLAALGVPPGIVRVTVTD
jgi:hypothetical protein